MRAKLLGIQRIHVAPVKELMTDRRKDNGQSHPNPLTIGARINESSTPHMSLYFLVFYTISFYIAETYKLTVSYKTPLLKIGLQSEANVNQNGYDPQTDKIIL